MKFELSDEHIRVIGHGLGLCPYGVAAPVITELQRQIDAHNVANAPKPEAVTDKKKPSAKT